MRLISPTISAKATHALHALDAIEDGVLNVDTRDKLTYMNRAAERLTGWPLDLCVGRNCSEILKIFDSTSEKAEWDPVRSVESEEPASDLLPATMLIRRDGTKVCIEEFTTPIRDADGLLLGATILFRDVSLARTMLLRAVHRAHHDVLTKLPNRLLFEDRIAQAIASTRRRPHGLGVLYLDLDNFKEINDAEGHDSGDEVLRVAARRIASCLRASDTVCRLGGDEFAILLPEVNGAGDIECIAAKVLKELRLPIHFRKAVFLVTASLGSILYFEGQHSPETLLKEADRGMYRAKQLGGNCACSVSEPLGSRHPGYSGAEGALEQALENSEFFLCYQPKIDLRTDTISGVEALIRWVSPDGRLIHPSSFIPLAERTGLIIPIGQWVLGEALRQKAMWEAQGLPALRILINVSSIELQNLNYLTIFDRICAENAYNQQEVTLEITESVLLDHGGAELLLLAQLRQRGVRLAIDDFGTGYSNLGYLRHFPIDYLKIDRSFIADCTSNEHDAALVKAMIGMGQSLKTRIIAEGVETEEQILLLKRLGCDYAQGFYFAPALTAVDLTEILIAQAGRADTIAVSH